MAKTFLDIQNLRASLFNETVAAKILDVDLARFYNEILSDMASQGLNLKKVTTNIVAAQSDYTNSVLPGIVATALVRVGGIIAPFISIDNFAYSSDRAILCHTMIGNSVSLIPTPTVAATNGLEVWYWAKLPEIIDTAVAGTALVELDDSEWFVITAGISAKCYQKLMMYFQTKREEMPDADLSNLIQIQKTLDDKYLAALEKYGNFAKFFNSPASHGPAANENDIGGGVGIGRQVK